jgi:C4-dicarboxylate-specific signal transduction histidine kinase
MKEFLEKLFSSSFMPHGHCYLWNPGLIWLHVVSDSLIALAYFFIPVTLIYFIQRRRDLPFHWVFVCFGIFILTCGATHIMEVWTLWHPNYWLSGAIKAVTAIASVPTAILLFHSVPQALALPSPEALRLEIAERKRTEQALHQAKDDLELKVLERTAELRKANEDLIAEIAQHKQADEDRERAQEAYSKAQAELVHVTRVITIGELAASIAHEVNQPLSGVVINGNTCLRWLAANPPNLDEARQTAQRIVRDGKRAGDLIARIRTLATKSSSTKEPVNLNQAIQDAIGLIQDEVWRKGVKLRTDLANDLSPVMGDRVQLQQVLLNLIKNGVEAMITVEERARELVIKTQNDEDQVRVEVQDSGIGLDEEIMQKIFEAFYSTKPEGMGMGLSISRSIVENHGGRLRATPNDGPGVTFQFTIPQYQ